MFGLTLQRSKKLTRLTAGRPAARFSVDIPPEMLQAMTANGILAPKVGRAEALSVPAVLRARNLIAGTLSTLPIHVRDRNKNIVPNALLDQIDPDVSNSVTLAETYEDLLFEAVSWWRVDSVNYAGFPVSAHHVPLSSVHVATLGGLPSTIRIGETNLPVDGQVYIDGIPVRDEEVIRFDSPNPPLLKHAARAIRTCLRLDSTASNYADAPTPLGYLRPKDGETVALSDEEIEDLMTDWEDARRRRAWAYIPESLEAGTLQWNAEQIQLADQRKHAVLEIARATGIDPEDLGVSTTSRTYQNSEDRRRALIDFTLKPYMVAVEQRLSMNDVLPRGYEAKVNLDSFLRSDTKTRMEAYQIGKSVGAYTDDEIRDLEDRPPLTASEKAAINNQPANRPPVRVQ